jgi:hypothetical protein
VLCDVITDTLVLTLSFVQLSNIQDSEFFGSSLKIILVLRRPSFDC